MALTPENVTDFMATYNQRRAYAEKEFEEKYRRIRAGRRAWRQFMPDPMADVATASADTYVNQDEDFEEPANTSQYLYPIQKAVVKKMIETLSEGSPEYELEANDKVGSMTKKFIEKEIRKVFAKENIGLKQLQAYYNATEGTIISQTVTKMLIEDIIMPDGTKKPITQGRTIDMIIYDPLTVMPDPNASPSDPMGTSQWIIVTIGYYTAEYLKETYGYEAANTTTTQGFRNDRFKEDMMEDSGRRADGLIPIREYYQTDGVKHVIIGDSELIESSVVSNGIYGRIPLNISQTYYDPDNIFGETLFEILQPSVEMASAAMNQICDNNSRNNNAPIVALKNCGLDGMTLNAFNPNEVIEIDPQACGAMGMSRSMDINGMFTKLTFPEVTNGAMFMFEQALQAAFMLSGVNPMSFGMQDKQVRTNGVAGMIDQAGVKSSSEFMKRLLLGWVNPTTADVQRIFGIYFNDFEFPEGITQENIQSMKSLRVVAGSYLPADKMTKLGKHQVLMERAAMNPMAYNQRDLEERLAHLLGLEADEMLKTEEEIQFAQQQQAIMMAQAQGGSVEQ